MASGIYSIEHVASGRRYVGSAANIDKRWKEHRRQLARGVHHSRFLQRAWDKHGDHGFRFSVVLFCDRHNLLWYEQALIDAWRPEYNSAPTAGSQLGLKMSDEAKAKMSVAAKRTRNFTGHRHSEAAKRQISAKKTGHRYGRYPKDRVERVAAAMRASKGAMGESEVRIIRRLHAEGLPHIEVAQWVGRSYWAVADVVRNRTFKWVK